MGSRFNGAGLRVTGLWFVVWGPGVGGWRLPGSALEGHRVLVRVRVLPIALQHCLPQGPTHYPYPNTYPEAHSRDTRSSTQFDPEFGAYLFDFTWPGVWRSGVGLGFRVWGFGFEV